MIASAEGYTRFAQLLQVRERNSSQFGPVRLTSSGERFAEVQEAEEFGLDGHSTEGG